MGAALYAFWEVESVQAGLQQRRRCFRREGAWTNLLITAAADCLRYERKLSRRESTQARRAMTCRLARVKSLPPQRVEEARGRFGSSAGLQRWAAPGCSRPRIAALRCLPAFEQRTNAWRYLLAFNRTSGMRCMLLRETIHHSLDGLCCFVSLLVRHVIASVTCLRCCLIRSAGASSCTPCGAGTFYASTGERQSGLCAGYRDRSLA